MKDKVGFIKKLLRYVSKRKDLFLFILFSLVVVFIFRSYFVNNKVPFPANLFVATYQPWASYPAPEYPSGPPNKPLGFDNIRIFYPLRKITTDSIKNFQVPLWDPYVFSGNTLLATYQSAVFHPLSLLFIILPQIDAWSVIIILAPIFCYFFTYLYLRGLNLSRLSSFFGSIAFSLSLANSVDVLK